MVSSSASVRQCHFCGWPNEREGISVIAFCTPRICSGVSGDAPFIFILNANARTSCPATTELFDASLFTQLTVGWLSLNTAAWSPLLMLHTSSITSQSSSMPAHSRSEFVSLPVGFLSEFISALMSAGHSIRNTVGMQLFASPTMMPPTPYPEASFTPT